MSFLLLEKAIGLDVSQARKIACPLANRDRVSWNLVVAAGRNVEAVGLMEKLGADSRAYESAKNARGIEVASYDGFHPLNSCQHNCLEVRDDEGRLCTVARFLSYCPPEKSVGSDDAQADEIEPDHG